MKKTLSLLLSLALSLTLVATPVFAADPGSYAVGVTRTANGQHLNDLRSLAVGTEVTVSVTLTRTDVSAGQYNCRGMELDINDYGLEYIEDSAETFSYRLGGSTHSAAVSKYAVGGATGVGTLRFYFIYGEKDANAPDILVDRAVTVSARYRVTDPAAARAWAPTPIVYVASARATDIRQNEYAVSFNANGGSLKTDPSGIYAEGEVLTLPVPTRIGYIFNGWYDGTAVRTGSHTVTAETAFTARWTRDPSVILGTATDSDGVTPLPGVEITLMRGGERVSGPIVTDAKGRFAVSVSEGVYDLVAHDTSNNRTKTELVTVGVNTDELKIVMPGRATNSVLDNSGAGQYAAVVGGLDGVAAAENPASGETITVTLTVTSEENAASRLSAAERERFNSGKNAISALSDAKGKTVDFLNLKLERVSSAAPGKTTDISASNTRLLTIVIPFQSAGKQNIAVYRYVGAAEAMTRNPAAGQEGYTVDADSIRIYTKSVSVCGIGYTLPSDSSEDKGGTTPVKPTSPEDTGVSRWLITAEHPAYLNGYADGRILPKADISRAEVAMIFYRLLLNRKTETLGSFSDVSDGRWYTDAVRTLAGMGIIRGYENGTFRPSNKITRREFAAIVTRFAKATGGTSRFSDVQPGNWAYANIATAADYGWVTGYNGQFRPLDRITRAEVAAIVNRMLGRSADQDYVAKNAAALSRFSDLQNPATWYYYDMVEASTPHNFTMKNGVERWN